MTAVQMTLSRTRPGAHHRKVITIGCRHERMLRILAGGVNCLEKDPRYLHLEPHSAIELQRETNSLSLATDISECRYHLRRRWPHADIRNSQELVDGVKHSKYWITAL